MPHIEPRGNSFRVRYYNSKGKLEGQTFSTEEEAQDFIDVMKAEKIQGRWIDSADGRMKLDDWFEQWRPLQGHLRPTTRERDDFYYRSMVKPAFGHLPVNKITQPMVVRFVNELWQDGNGSYSAATVTKAYQILSKLLRAAKAARMIAFLPFEEVKLPPIPVREMMIISEEEADLLHDWFPSERYKLFVTLGIYAGLRHGELAALRPSRVNFLRRRIKVMETLVELRSTGHQFHETKTRAGRREVPIPQFVVDEIEAHIETFKVGKDDLMFVGDKGGIPRKSNFRERLWKPAVHDLDLDGFRVHDMRHTAVSLWIANGANFKEIAVWAGHRSVATVIDRYGHLYEDGGVTLTDRLDANRAQRLAGKARTAKKGRTSA